MSPSNFALGLTIIAISVGFLGNLLANFLWWIINNYNKKEIKNCRIWIFGISFILLFILSLIWAYSIFSKNIF